MFDITLQNLKQRKKVLESYGNLSKAHQIELGLIDGQIFQREVVINLEKGKKANFGEIREWGGGKYQKTTQGWMPIKKHTPDNGGNSEKRELSDQEKEDIVNEWFKTGKVNGEKFSSPIKLSSRFNIPLTLMSAMGKKSSEKYVYIDNENGLNDFDEDFNDKYGGRVVKYSELPDEYKNNNQYKKYISKPLDKQDAIDTWGVDEDDEVFKKSETVEMNKQDFVEDRINILKG